MLLKYPEISPIIFQLGPFALRWYGLMYAIGFIILLVILRRQARQGFLPLSESDIERFFVWLIAGLIIGARVFYVIFYATDSFLENPFSVFAIWRGGMSFHGGLAGVAVVSTYFARRHRVPWLAVADTLVLSAPFGLGLGRIGNFINGELFGRVTEVPWGMVFPAGGPLARHPSQLYEALLEGVMLGVVLWSLRPRVKRHGLLAGTFLVGYGLARIFVEFFREPDVQLGFILGPFTMGQLLSLGVVIPGIALLIYSAKNGPLVAAGPKDKKGKRRQ